MPTTYRPRASRCSHCGDVVLVVEQSAGSLLGLRLRRRSGAPPGIRLEHADPGPDGEVFDGVDRDCRRRPVG